MDLFTRTEQNYPKGRISLDIYQNYITNTDEIIQRLRNFENLHDVCLVITTCKHYSSNLPELSKQIQMYNTVFPKENIWVVSGQEDENSINYTDGIKRVNVTYSGLHLTGAIYILENIHEYPHINYWILLPDTIKFGPRFFKLMAEVYRRIPPVHAIPFINPKIRPTMDIGILHSDHIINLQDYLTKIKHDGKDELGVLKLQLIYNENSIFGEPAICYQESTKFKYVREPVPPTYFIINDWSELYTSIDNNIQTVYFKPLDLYKYQRNFKGPGHAIVMTL
jgi:hypothetical protein